MTTGTMQLSALGQAAVDYASDGWRVFPLVPRGKMPLIPGREGGSGCKDGTTDLEQVTDWWMCYPDANIGLATGEGIVVLDVDGEEGQDSLTVLEANYGLLPQTLECQTGTGRHIYFRYDGELGNSAGRLGSKLDTRGDGGYVILPPSVHPNGAQYTWVNAGTEVAELPDWMVQELQPKKFEPEYDFVLRDVGRKSEKSYGDLHPYIAKFFSNKCNALATAPSGTRNQRLNELAFECGRIAQGGYGNPTFMETSVKNAAVAAGLGWGEIEKTWNSGYQKGWQAAPYVIPDRDEPNQMSPREAREQPLRKPTKGALVITPLSKVKREHVDYLWGYRLVQQGVNLLIGDGGLGKSALALHIARSITNGERLPDDQDQQVRGKVMLITYEDPPDLVKSRARVLGIDMDEFFVIEGEKDEDGRLMPFNKDSVIHLIAALEDYPDTRMLIVDPWGRYLDDDDNKEKVIRRAIAPLEELARRCNVTILIVGHTNKSSEYTSAEHRIAGHSAFKNVARSVLMIGKISDSTNAVAHVKHNWSAPAHAVCYSWDENKKWADNENPLSWGEVVKMNADELFAPRKVTKVDQCVRWLRQQLVDGPVSVADLVEMADEEGFTNQLKKAANRLGVVDERPGLGTETQWRLPHDSENPAPTDQQPEVPTYSEADVF